MSNTTNAKPAATLRDGALKATIWENQGKEGTYLSTKFAKTYKDKNNKFQETTSFNESDLLKVAELARSAYRANKKLRQQSVEQYQQQEPSLERG